MKDWVYKSPLKMGFIRVKISKAQHKSIFKVRKVRIWDSPAYFYNGEKVIVEHLCAWWFIALIALPHLLIGPLLMGIPKTIHEFRRAAFQRRHGSYSSDEWMVIPGSHRPDEQPIVDAWLKYLVVRPNTNN